MATEEKDTNNVVDDELETSIDDTTTEIPQNEVQNSDEDKTEALNKELQEEKDKYIRLYAEFQNYRNRTTKEKTEAYNNATAKCIEDILPVVDDFERALNQECTDEKYKSGMQMIFKHFINILDKMGVKEIDALGKPFDPNIHHAIQQLETDEFESDTVCAVFQKGYMLGERLIRPAMVQVAV